MSRSRSNSNSLHMQTAESSSNGNSTSHALLADKPSAVTTSKIAMPSNDTDTNKKLVVTGKPKISYIVTLAPLNNTFVKKVLILPPFPQTLKLGRPLTAASGSNGVNTSQTMASSNNGFFESRILSRTHAQLQLTEDNEILITDLNSSNGSYLNDNKLQPMKQYKVAQGDVITLGADIIPNNSNANSGNNFNGIHRRIVALVQEITPIVDLGYKEQDTFNKRMLQSSLFGDLIGDVDDYKLFTHGNSFLLDSEEEEEGITKIYKFLKKEIHLSNERNYKLERINVFMKNFVKEIGVLDEKNFKHLEQVKKNYYDAVNDSLSKKYEVAQEKNLKILKDKNFQLENSFINFRKEKDEKLLTVEEQMNKMRNTIEDLETKLQVAKVKQPVVEKLEKETEINENGKENNQRVVKSESEVTLNEKTKEVTKNDDIAGPVSKDYKIAYISSICVVGIFSAFMAYSQNK